MKNPNKDDLKKELRVRFFVGEGQLAEGIVVGQGGNYYLIVFDKNHKYKHLVSHVIEENDKFRFGISDQYIGREA